MGTLIKFRADPNNYNADGVTPLIKAMSFSDPFMFRGIIEAEPSLDPVDLRGWNIAIYAVRYGLLFEVVDYLQHLGSTGDLAAQSEIVKNLFAYQDPQGYTPLHHAVIIQD